MDSRSSWIRGVGAAVLVAPLAAGAVWAQSPGGTVAVYLNGGRLRSNALMLQQVGRTLLPMRTLFESLGAQVEWDASQQAVYAWNPNGQGVRLGLVRSTPRT
jgi:hypothetical protein